ncbi:hypothetical protein VCJ71_00860 [Alteriqipengyuania sp. WL0013]|uniref:hypothetical protein n=1 Tax=Alteriqipengyuania sp. WL0013 TaxID=3110773 RepID=UPI002C377B1C|nr:hypothetical protein [Alteriqipengyuania sp. WL0013]MEB3414606.1 hypothetical protein [Alteriqipengyuania sp. WL0013]
MSFAADMLAWLAAFGIFAAALTALVCAARAQRSYWLAALACLCVCGVVLAEVQYDGRATWAFYAFILPALAAAVVLGSLIAAAIGRYRRNRAPLGSK